MKAREWFGVALRITGVVSFVYAAVYFLDALLFRLGYLNYPDSGPVYYVIMGIFHLLVGLYLVRGAPLLVSFAYPTEEEEEIDEEEAEQNDA